MVAVHVLVTFTHCPATLFGSSYTRQGHDNSKTRVAFPPKDAIRNVVMPDIPMQVWTRQTRREARSRLQVSRERAISRMYIDPPSKDDFIGNTKPLQDKAPIDRGTRIIL